MKDKVNKLIIQIQAINLKLNVIDPVSRQYHGFKPRCSNTLQDQCKDLSSYKVLLIQYNAKPVNSMMLDATELANNMRNQILSVYTGEHR